MADVWGTDHLRQPVVWLGQADVEVPGGERYWHHVIRLNRAAIMVLLDDRDQVLMLWRHRFVPDRWGWELPGGWSTRTRNPRTRRYGNLRKKRATAQESVEHLITFQALPGIAASEHFAFVGRNPERVGDPTDLSEAARVEWVPLESVARMIETGDIWDAESLVALSLVLMKSRG